MLTGRTFSMVTDLGLLRGQDAPCGQRFLIRARLCMFHRASEAITYAFSTCTLDQRSFDAVLTHPMTMLMHGRASSFHEARTRHTVRVRQRAGMRQTSVS